MNAQDHFIRCRAIGHAWYEVPDDRQWSSSRVWRHCIVLRCERCGMTRYDGLDSRGEVGQRMYVRPEGYSYPLHETPTRAELRMVMVRDYETRMAGRS
jgi:hypothetical protein